MGGSIPMGVGVTLRGDKGRGQGRLPGGEGLPSTEVLARPTLF